MARSVTRASCGGVGRVALNRAMERGMPQFPEDAQIRAWLENMPDEEKL
jgi:hypothetical protein